MTMDYLRIMFVFLCITVGEKQAVITMLDGPPTNQCAKSYIYKFILPLNIRLSPTAHALKYIITG